MKKHISNQKGFSILELIIASAAFLLFSTAAIGIFSQSLNVSRLGGQTVTVDSLIAEGLEAVRSIRDRDFNALYVTNTASSVVTSSSSLSTASLAPLQGKKWVLGADGTYDQIGSYTRYISIEKVRRQAISNNITTANTSPYDPDTLKVTVNILWRPTATGSLVTRSSYAYMTNFKRTVNTVPTTYQCSDGVDNDLDGLTDYPSDSLGCTSLTDNDETDPPPPPTVYQCNDRIDNDSDHDVDYPTDSDCDSLTDDSEYYVDQSFPECNDRIDNDGDNRTDYPADPDCSSEMDNSESGVVVNGNTCGGWDQAQFRGAADLDDKMDAVKVAVSDYYTDYEYVVRTDVNGNRQPGLYVLDMTGSLAPDGKSPVLTGFAAIEGNARNIFVRGDYAFIATDKPEAEIQVYNISNAYNPQAWGAINLTGDEQAANDVFVDPGGQYAYVVRDSKSTDNNFYVLDVSAPNNPQELGSTFVGNNLLAVDFDDSTMHAYVATDMLDQEVQVVNVTNPNSPAYYSHFNINPDKGALSVSRKNTVLSVGTFDGNVAFLNISNPGVLSEMSRVAVANALPIYDIVDHPGLPCTFAVSDETEHEFTVIDMTDPYASAIIAVVDAFSARYGVAYNSNLDKVSVVGTHDDYEVGTIIHP